MQSTLSGDSFFNRNYDKQFEHDINHPVDTQTTFISEAKRKYYNDYWEILHLIGYLYPENPSHSDKIQINLVFNYIANGGLPCSSCITHFKNYMKQQDLYDICKNRKNLKNFMIDLHNHVNQQNNKEILSYETVDEMYVNIKDKCNRILKEKNIDIIDRLKKYEVYTFIDDLN